MKILTYFKRLVQGDKAAGSRGMGGSGVHAIVVWLFIALVALFLTHPSGQPPSLFARPIPLPAELEQAAPAASRAPQPLALADSACLRIVSSVAFGVIRLPS